MWQYLFFFTDGEKAPNFLRRWYAESVEVLILYLSTEIKYYTRAYKDELLSLDKKRERKKENCEQSREKKRVFFFWKGFLSSYFVFSSLHFSFFFIIILTFFLKHTVISFFLFHAIIKSNIMQLRLLRKITKTLLYCIVVCYFISRMSYVPFYCIKKRNERTTNHFSHF